jgi:hypothetical protein
MHGWLGKDKMHLLGWPEISTQSVSQRELKILTGEAIHLGNLGLFLGSALFDPTAPWWGVAAAVGTSEASGDVAASVAQGAQVSAPKRRRRIGPVKSMT